MITLELRQAPTDKDPRLVYNITCDDCHDDAKHSLILWNKDLKYKTVCFNCKPNNDLPYWQRLDFLLVEAYMDYLKK